MGQHFLIDGRVIDKLVATVIERSKVIEGGSVIGHVTEALAQQAGSVIEIEIDRRFQPTLEDIQERNPIVRFIFGDALRVQFSSLICRDEETQIIANLHSILLSPLCIS